MKKVIGFLVVLVCMLLVWAPAMYAVDEHIAARTKLAVAPAEDDVIPLYDLSETAGVGIEVLPFFKALESALTGYEIHIDNISANLKMLDAITYSANMQAFLAAADYAAMRSQMGLDTGDAPTFAGLTSTGNITLNKDATNSPILTFTNVDDISWGFYNLATTSNFLIYVDSADTESVVITNTGAGNANLTVNGDAIIAGAISGTTLNTGNGANELYSMNQDVETTDAVVFATVNTGNGANELYSMNQDVETTDAVDFATVNTGMGDNELYDMDQNVQTTDAPTFRGVSISYTPVEDAEVETTVGANSFEGFAADLTKPDDYFIGMEVRHEDQGGTACHGTVTDYVLSTGAITHTTLGPNCSGDGELQDGDTYSILKPGVGMEYDMLPDTDLTCSGEMMTVTAGASVTWGQCLARDTTDSRFIPANANSAGVLPCRVFACEDGADGDAIVVLTRGTARNDAWDLDVAGTTANRELIISDLTAGEIIFQDGDGLDNVASGQVPDDDDDIVQIVGYPITNKVLYFSASQVWAVYDAP